MTVADNTSRNQYTATSGQTVFAYTFEIVDKDHIVVLQNGTALSEGTDYTVSNVGNDSGGNITLTSGATAGDIMTLYRDMPYSRTQNYTNSGDFLASEVNADFDELWLAGEQTDRSFSQSIRKPITDSDSISMELPEAATRANKFVKFDATGAVDVAGATVTVAAEDVSITDAGNYYTSDNVEGALQEVGASLDTKLENVVEDTTPQLGGNLDLNSNDITGTGNVNITGNVALSGTVDGRDVATDGTKLDGIEAGADVTDTANVTAAGAVMDSELTNEAAVKALNQGVATTDSPTFAGLTTTADVSFGDNDRANFGDSQDLQMYHDGSNSYIYDQGTGYLVLQSGGPGIRLNKSNAEVMVDATPDGAVTLYHDNSAKIATSSTGVEITGTATVGAVTYTGTDGTDGQVLMTDGAGNASFEDMPSSTYLDVKDFGATGDGSTDDTTAIQNAINHASNNEIQTIFFPDGHYKYTTLRFYHDATDNPNFQETPNRDGRFQLRGTGRLAITDLKNVGKSPNRIYGAILESTSTGDGLIVEPTGTFQTTTDARNFVVKDLTLVADNTGYIVTAESCPGLTFDHCSFKQLNHQGSGILARNCWFFTMNQCYVFGQSWIDEDFATAGQTEFSYTFDNPASTSDIIVQKKGGLVSSSDYSINTTTKVVTLNTGADLNDKVTISRKNTGDGISSQFVGSAFGSFAGLWNITDSLVDSWANGVHWTGGQVTNLSLRNTGVQNCNNYNIYGDAGVIQQMLLDNVYMENQSVQGVSFIKGDGSGTSSATIRNLRMINCFMLAGGTFPRVTGTCIDIDSIEVIDIEGMYVFRMRQPFLNITATKNLQNVPGEIKNSLFATDQDLSAEPTIYLLSGKIPNVHNCVWPGFSDGFYDTTNDILLFDPSVESNFPRQYTDIKGTTGTAKFGFGDTKVVTGITSGPYNITGSNSRTYYDLTHSIAGGLKVILPDTGEVNDGRLIIIKNNEASTSTSQFPYINVVNNSDQNTTIGRLSPGQAGLFILDQQNSTEFKYVGRTFTDDLELTDDHKITFGRGTSAGPDMEIYHDSASGESRIDTLAGLTLNGLTYPTADGTSGQSIITDGSGNLTFGTAAGTGITAVVEDTTPQLGGDLESNGNDILFADNDKAIFGAGSDLQIYHDGSNSYVRDVGTGHLNISGEEVRILNSINSEIKALFTTDGSVELYHDNAKKIETTSTGIDVTGSINTVLSVDGTTEDVFITGATPGLEFVENDSGGSRMRMAWNTSGSFSPTLYQSLYGDSTTTYGGINIQTRASDGSGNQVVYAYDPINDRNWWGTRAAGDVRMQLQSDGTFNVRGGDVIFENSAQTSDDFFWDASTSRLGVGTSNPRYNLSVSGNNATAIGIALDNASGSGTADISILGAGYASHQAGAGEVWFYSPDNINIGGATGNTNNIKFLANNKINMFIEGSSGNVGIGTSPSNKLDIKGTVGFEATNSTNKWLAYTYTDNSLRLNYNGAGADEVVIDSGGNVILTKPNGAYLQFKDASAVRGAINVTTSDGLVFTTGASFSERMRIDSSGNVLVGKAGAGIGTTGQEFRSYGSSYLTSSEDTALGLNRLSTDGTVLEIRKDSTVVGSIGSTSGVATHIILDPRSSVKGAGIIGGSASATEGVINSTDRTGATQDGTISLGTSGTRWKDLYLSGGVQNVTASGVAKSTLISAISGVTNGFQIHANSSNQMTYDFNTGLGLKMQLTNGGDLFVGTSAAPTGSTGGSGFITESVGRKTLKIACTTTSGAGLAEFINPNGVVGTIVTNGSSTAYNQSSDERLKENIVDAPSASDEIDAIQVRSFDWKADGSHQKYGMVAQELNTVAPDAVTIPDDPEEMAGVDYSKLVPMLVKEIQSLRARVAQLEGAN